MGRESMPKPEEVGAIVAEVIRAIQVRADEDASHGPPERQRSRASDARRQRDEDALVRDSAARRALIVEHTLAHVVPPKVFDLITGPSAMKTSAYLLALDWWDAGRERVCVLRGGKGTGKSTGAGLACKHAAETGKRSISWHRPNDFVSAILHAYDDEAPQVGGDLVVLDDMGRETKADFAEALTTFLDNRRTRLLITTNDPLAVWTKRYDPRLLDRLADEGVAYDVKGESMRQKGAGF